MLTMAFSLVLMELDHYLNLIVIVWLQLSTKYCPVLAECCTFLLHFLINFYFYHYSHLKLFLIRSCCVHHRILVLGLNRA